MKNVLSSLLILNQKNHNMYLLTSNVHSTSLIIQNFQNTGIDDWTSNKYWHSQYTNFVSSFVQSFVHDCVQKHIFKLRELHNFRYIVYFSKQNHSQMMKGTSIMKLSHVDRNFLILVFIISFVFTKFKRVYVMYYSSE